MNIEILEQWWNTGRLRPEHPILASTSDDARVGDWLVLKERHWKKQLPKRPPLFTPVAARWALRQFYRATQLLAYPELPESLVAAGLEAEPPSEELGIASQASTHYSVDLIFRFVPDLHRLTKTIMNQDVLLQFLESWCVRWPLSGAHFQAQTLSTKGLEEILQNPFVESVIFDPCLHTLYTERLLGSNPGPEILEAWNRAVRTICGSRRSNP